MIVTADPSLSPPHHLTIHFERQFENQLERTLIFADETSVVEYVEACTAPQSRKNQLHAAVFELYRAEDAVIKSTLQIWYAGNSEGKGGTLFRASLKNLLDPSRDRVSHHMEIS